MKFFAQMSVKNYNGQEVRRAVIPLFDDDQHITPQHISWMLDPSDPFSSRIEVDLKEVPKHDGASATTDNGSHRTNEP